MDWIGSCGLGTGNGFSLGDDNSRLIHQHISQSNRKTIFSTPTITTIFRAFLETVMKRWRHFWTSPSSSISTSTGLNMRNFFFLLFHSASIAPDRREIKATKLLTVERPTSHKERGATVYLFFLFSFCAITNQTEKKERKENHISRLHMGLLAEWILYIVAASFLSPPKVLSAGLTIRCNGVRWSKPIALLLTQSDPAAFFFSPRRLLFCSRHRQ